MKAVAVSRAIGSLNGSGHSPLIEEMLVHTGQHYSDSLSEVFFRGLDLPAPDHNLAVGSGSHAYQTAEMLKRLEPILLAKRPDLAVVYGDTNSTLAGALGAAKLGIPLAHVEAGLRSWKRDMPEEINRIVTDRLAGLLLCPSERARANLALEGLTEGVEVVGDVMLDLLRWQLEHSEEDGGTILDRLGVRRREYALVTVHRAATADDRIALDRIVQALNGIVRAGLDVVLPLHPRTQLLFPAQRALAGVRLIEPVPFEEMISLEANARVIVTDSGGVQKEAYWLGVPCVTLRSETEWPETVEAGWNRLVGCEPEAIREAAMTPWPTSPRPSLYGDGRAANRVVDSLMVFAESSRRS